MASLVFDLKLGSFMDEGGRCITALSPKLGILYGKVVIVSMVSDLKLGGLDDPTNIVSLVVDLKLGFLHGSTIISLLHFDVKLGALGYWMVIALEVFHLISESCITGWSLFYCNLTSKWWSSNATRSFYQWSLTSNWDS